MDEKGSQVRYRPSVRWPFMLFNGAVGGLDRLRSQPTFSISRDEVLRQAARATGITDLDTWELGEPLQRWCDSLRDPGLTPVGRWLSKASIVSAVTNRLRIERLLRDDPAIRDEPLHQPWFVMGLPRSGTTLLHRLLAQDPEHRAPLFWEVSYPFPRGPRDLGPRRLAAARRMTRLYRYALPDMRTKHETDAESAEECRLLLSNSLVREGHEWFMTKDFDQEIWSAARTRAYQLHRIQLQYLQRNRPPKKWVLKDPAHIFNLRWLLDVYPDACIIKLHRDPVEALPSLASLVTSRMQYGLREVDLQAIGQQCHYYASLTCFAHFNTQEGSDELAARGVRFIDVKYPDLMSDPIATVAGIYARFDRDLTAQARRRMQSYMDSNPKTRFGTHRYALLDFGLDEANLRETFAPYVQRYL
jgi:hypothetical protein